MRAWIYVPFISSNGAEYELEIEPQDDGEIYRVTRFTEDGRGKVTAEPSGKTWDGLIEMTHSLRITIVAWRCDPGN
jgi:hypothetical protein